MRLTGIKDLIENEDFVKYKNGHVIIKYDNLYRHSYKDGFFYHIIYDDNKMYRSIEFMRSQVLGYKEPNSSLYFDVINNTMYFIDFHKELENIKKQQEFHKAFEDYLK